MGPKWLRGPHRCRWLSWRICGRRGARAQAGGTLRPLHRARPKHPQGTCARASFARGGRRYRRGHFPGPVHASFSTRSGRLLQDARRLLRQVWAQAPVRHEGLATAYAGRGRLRHGVSRRHDRPIRSVPGLGRGGVWDATAAACVCIRSAACAAVPRNSTPVPAQIPQGSPPGWSRGQDSMSSAESSPLAHTPRIASAQVTAPRAALPPCSWATHTLAEVLCRDVRGLTLPSHPPPCGWCYADTYTLIDKVHYDFLSRVRTLPVRPWVNAT